MGTGRTKLEFPGTDGLDIAGLLETPGENPQAFVLFAHCFTCSKNVLAASRIARALVARGFAVLRFDFTGLGSSEGDFANSNFSANVTDLVHAADYLRAHYRAPALLIGHSLGGAAVLAAAHRVPEAAGVVTIGAPSDPEHVIRQFACEVKEIEEQGSAEVSLGGRAFTIKKQFLEEAYEWFRLMCIQMNCWFMDSRNFLVAGATEKTGLAKLKTELGGGSLRASSTWRTARRRASSCRNPGASVLSNSACRRATGRCRAAACPCCSGRPGRSVACSDGIPRSPPG